jgi:dissimilatory sulfite reductase (desulfoviridin) alpha/beta subunit
MSEIDLRIVTESTVVKVKIGKEASERVERLQATGELGACLGCEREFVKDEQTRCGQCMTCYSASLKAIKKGRVTRVSLIRKGKMLPPANGGRRPANPFTQSLLDSE